jgi:glycosyltransferase involved in cell wall biosynthesis
MAVQNSISIGMILDNPLVSDKRVEKEAYALQKAGFTVKIYATKEAGLEDKTNIHETIEVIRVIGSWLYRPLSANYTYELIKLAALIEKEKHDIIYCHDFKTIAVGVELKRNSPKLKLVYDCHEYLRGWPLYKEGIGIFNRIKGFFVWRRFLVLERTGFSYADLVICTSPMIADQLVKDHQFKKQPTVVQNIPEALAKSILDSKFLLGIPQEATLIAHVGSMYFSMSELHSILNIIEESKRCHIVFIGNRPYHASLKTFCAKNQLQHTQVIDYNAYPLMDFLAGCDLGLVHIQSKKYPNHDFASSNKFMEYILAGIPVISVNQSMHKKVNKELPFTSFYEEGDPNSFKKALDHALKNHQEFKTNVVKIRTKFDWNNEAAALVDEIQTLANIIKNDSK